MRNEKGSAGTDIAELGWGCKGADGQGNGNLMMCKGVE